MLKNIILTALCLSAFASCAKEETPQNSDLTDVSFDMGTRAAAGTGAAEDGDTYSMISYPSGSAITTTGYQVGYYAYVTSGNGAFINGGVLVPIIPQTVWPYWNNNSNHTAISRNNAGGQKLREGNYRVAVIHPALPMGFVAGLGYMAVFKRKEAVYASDPNDYNLDDGATVTPFALNVVPNTNFTVWPFPTANGGVKMYPIQSAIKVYFYSSKGVTFTIPSISLVNAGKFGWYNPNTKRTYPSFGATYSVYDNTSIVAGDAITLTTPGGNVPVISPTYPIKYHIPDELVFPANYLGSGTGSDPFVIKPLTLSVGIQIDGSPVTITSDVALKLIMESGKRYTFYIDVSSGMFNISYSISAWGTANTGDPSTPIGDIYPLSTIPFGHGGDWTDTGGSGENIGN